VEPRPATTEHRGLLCALSGTCRPALVDFEEPDKLAVSGAEGQVATILLPYST